MSDYTFPLLAQDLRPEDAGAVIDVGADIAGRLVDVMHGPLGTALILEGSVHVVFVFKGSLVGTDRDHWQKLQANGDRRGACREAIAEQDRLELTRQAAASHTQRFQQVVSEGWDEVGGPDWTVDA